MSLSRTSQGIVEVVRPMPVLKLSRLHKPYGKTMAHIRKMVAPIEMGRPLDVYRSIRGGWIKVAYADIAQGAECNTGTD